MSPAHLLLAGEFFTTEPLGEPKSKFYWFKSYIVQFTGSMTVSFYTQKHTQSGNLLFGAYKSFCYIISEHANEGIREHSQMA